jgi:hypothetical protein
MNGYGIAVASAYTCYVAGYKNGIGSDAYSQNGIGSFTSFG